MIIVRRGRVSLRAKVARVGLRWFIRPRLDQPTLKDERRASRALDALIPRPPRSTRTIAVDAGGVKANWIVTPQSKEEHCVLFLHGGGYRTGSPSTYRHFTWRIASATGARLLAIDYRLAPEHPFPAALDDAISSYRWLLARGVDPRRLAVVGDSAGGGLALALMLKLRDGGIPLPVAVVALSPWTDLALTGAALKRNARADPMLNADDVPRFAADYLGGSDPHNPYASPLYGDLRGLPPTLLHVGSDEILLDDAVRMARKLQRANCYVELEIWPKMPHVWHAMAPFLPEARFAIARIGTFVTKACRQN